MTQISLTNLFCCLLQASNTIQRHKMLPGAHAPAADAAQQTQMAAMRAQLLLQLFGRLKARLENAAAAQEEMGEEMALGNNPIAAALDDAAVAAELAQLAGDDNTIFQDLAIALNAVQQAGVQQQQ